MAKKKKTNKPLKVIAGAPDRPLIVGGVELDCYVLENETRVLSQRGIFRSINVDRTSFRVSMLDESHGVETDNFGGPKWLRPFISTELAMALKSPVLFQRSEGGRPTYGYSATILVDLCRAILEADKDGRTTDRHTRTVERAMTLVSGLATVGIIALVDEATGYQRIREERALATILERFIAKELQPWTKTFPYEFYEQIFRLKGWPGPEGVKRPQVIGHYTNDIIYDRLAPGLWDQLKKINPSSGPGRRKNRHHQWFTPDLGHPKLKERLACVTTLMRASPNWDVFMRLLNRAFPKQTTPRELDIDPEK